MVLEKLVLILQPAPSLLLHRKFSPSPQLRPTTLHQGSQTSALEAPHLQSITGIPRGKMPVMTVRDEREKLKKVSPLLITTVLPTERTREKVEYTRADGSIGKVLLPMHAAESVGA
jgi:hypothetical protein